MNCGSLEEITLIHYSDEGKMGGSGGGWGNPDNEGDVDTEAVEPVDLPGGGYTTPVVDEDKDPCVEAKEIAKNNNYNKEYNKHTKNTGLDHETGFQTDWNGAIKKMEPVGKTSMNMKVGKEGVRTADHVHNDLAEGEGVSVKVPFPRDINMLFNLVKNAYHQNKDFNAVSLGTISSQGNYKLYFTGTKDELKDLPYNAGGKGLGGLEKLNEEYATNYFYDEVNLTTEQRDTLLMKFLEKEVGTTKIAAVRMDDNGNPVKTITIDKNGKVSVVDC